MNPPALNPLEIAALFLLGGALLLGFLRLTRGPAAPDRLVAADTLGVIATAGLALLAWLLGSALYLDVALVYGVLSFVGVVALARAIEGERP
ncbi:MAG: monovalent cation/H+ antiporter complex subunit F [Thiobacillaceae bacterium]|jgi:multicomponent Na+:H+ antiporter subunit F